MKNHTLWALALGGALILAGGATPVFAQDAPAATAAVDEAAPAPLQWMGRGGFGEMDLWGLRGDDRGSRGWDGELLANALGISEEELDSAWEEAYAAVLTQAVEDGYITQAQADKWGDEPRAGVYVLREWYDDAAAAGFLADALGISAEELQAARDNVIPAAVEAGLIEQEDANLMQAGQLIVEAMQTARDEAVAQAVEQGLLTQEQADAITSSGRFGGLDGFRMPFMGDPGGMRGERDFGVFGGFGVFGRPGHWGGRR